MNQELEKLKQKVKEIDRQAKIARDVEVDADQASEKLSVKVEKDLSGIMLGGRALTDEEDSFDLDFSQIDLSDADIVEIIKSASDRARRQSPGGMLGGSDVPQIEVTRVQTPQGEMWKVLKECAYTTENGNLTVTVPKGFITDLASVPRVFWTIVASFELSLPAPVFHDLIYRFAGQVPSDYVSPSHVFGREETDDLFLELMKKSNVSLWKRRAAYRAVRTFASFAWKNRGINVQTDV